MGDGRPVVGGVGSAQPGPAQRADRGSLGRVLVENAAAGLQFDVAGTQDDAFWTWSVIETFRHTGV